MRLRLLAGLIALIVFLIVAQFLGLWIQALFASANVSIFDLIGMKMRRVTPRVVVESKIQAVKAGLLFVIANDFVKAEFTADKQGVHWMRWLDDTARLEKAIELGVWNPRPNFSCKGWCPVKDCVHNGTSEYR